MFKTFLPVRVLKRWVAASISGAGAALSARGRRREGDEQEDIFFLALAQHGHW